MNSSSLCDSATWQARCTDWKPIEIFACNDKNHCAHFMLKSNSTRTVWKNSPLNPNGRGNHLTTNILLYSSFLGYENCLFQRQAERELRLLVGIESRPNSSRDLQAGSELDLCERSKTTRRHVNKFARNLLLQLAPNEMESLARYIFHALESVPLI